MAVILWPVDSAATLKCNDYRFESSLAGHLQKGSIHQWGSQFVNVQSSVHGEGVYSVVKCTLKVQVF